jgi:hypothetical protein
MGRFAQAIIDGEYDAISKASRACVKELGAALAYKTVYSYLEKNTGECGTLPIFLSHVKARHDKMVGFRTSSLRRICTSWCRMVHELNR